MTRGANWHFVAGLLLVMGLVSALSVIGVSWWLTRQIDARHLDTTREVVSLKVEGTAEALQALVEDYAWWSLAWRIVEAGDEAQIYEHLGSGAVESEAFDALLILAPDGTLAHAFADAESPPGPALWAPEAFAPLLAALRAAPPLSYQSRSAVLRLAEGAEGVSFATAAWITPDEIAAFPDRPMPILIGLRHIDASWLADLARSPFILAPEVGREPRPGRVSHALELAGAAAGSRAMPAGHLTWQAARPGAALRADLLPWIAGLCIALAAGVLAATRYFRGVSDDLLRATRIARTDVLTGLQNRAGLEALLETDRLRSALARGDVAVVYIDLNGFKRLNDTHGHHVGDIALKVTATRLREAVRQGDTIVRIGGDEFICVIIDPEPRRAAQRVAERLDALMRAPVAFPTHDASIGVAIGIAVAEPGHSWPRLLDQADLAMYRAKSDDTASVVTLHAATSGGAAGA